MLTFPDTVLSLRLGLPGEGALLADRRTQDGGLRAHFQPLRGGGGPAGNPKLELAGVGRPVHQQASHTVHLNANTAPQTSSCRSDSQLQSLFV